MQGSGRVQVPGGNERARLVQPGGGGRMEKERCPYSMGFTHMGKEKALHFPRAKVVLLSGPGLFRTWPFQDQACFSMASLMFFPAATSRLKRILSLWFLHCSDPSSGCAESAGFLSYSLEGLMWLSGKAMPYIHETWVQSLGLKERRRLYDGRKKVPKNKGSLVNFGLSTLQSLK